MVKLDDKYAPGDAEAISAAWAQQPGVAYAEPDARYFPTVVPNDTSFTSLYGLNNVGQTGGKVDADIDALDVEVMDLIEQSVTEARAADRPTAQDVLTDVYISY